MRQETADMEDWEICKGMLKAIQQAQTILFVLFSRTLFQLSLKLRLVFTTVLQ